jgi:hypothetical protein
VEVTTAESNYRGWQVDHTVGEPQGMLHIAWCAMENKARPLDDRHFYRNTLHRMKGHNDANGGADAGRTMGGVTR